jgi:Putative esterase
MRHRYELDACRGYRAAMPQTPKITRRRLLAASVGAAAVGGLEVARGSGIRTWYQHFTGACDVTAAAPAQSNPRIATGSFDSRAARAQVGYAISLPRAGTDVARLPLVVCLPGRDTSAGGMLNLRLPDYAAAAGGHLALACVEGGSSYWHRRASGEDRMAMLTGEFLPMLSRQHGLGDSGLGILGWSMGGYGALLATELRPDLFGAAAALSPAM